MNENLFKTRSVLANMKTTINTLLQHYPTLFYKTLIPYLVAAMAFTTLLFAGADVLVANTDAPSLLPMLSSLVALPLALLLPAVAMAIVFGKLHKQPRTRCIKRNLIAALTFALLALVLYLLIDVAQQGVQTLWPSLIQENDLNDTQNIEIIKYTLTFILLLPFCPLNFAFTKYIITPTLPLRKTLKEACTTGLHNWGYLVSNQAAICFLCGVAYCLISIPVRILLNAYYLNAIGWRGIRQRKVNIGKAIQTASAKLREAGKPVHVLDIASGHGRYVLDALIADTLPDSVLLRDYSPINVEAGRKLIAERGLQETVTFNEVNAYDRANYHDLQPRPTLGIVSGLHELFADNDLILNSLYGFGEAIETGGYLIYTGQPWHPQLEMIARALTSHKAGSPNWVMRRRSQQEMDQLVEKAGFEKIHQWIDEDGIFTVSLAVKK